MCTMWKLPIYVGYLNVDVLHVQHPDDGVLDS